MLLKILREINKKNIKIIYKFNKQKIKIFNQNHQNKNLYIKKPKIRTKNL